ncbi:gephyrin-like molybdotransferase Glp [Oricola sp.]|uniref:molybdopterin molybdotransferase MoeA n=1 Tax=Oricola sp. TaxID=1979950 RepID=UPI003BA8E3D1
MKNGLIPVSEARERLLSDTAPLPTQTVPLEEAAGRILAADLAARRTQPPQPISAMDGYAVRAADIATAPAELRLVGQAAAGHPFNGTVGPGETARIFTGAVVPDGADTILIQEDATVGENGAVTANVSERQGRYVRPAGLDFETGQTVLTTGAQLDAGALCLAAAANHPQLPVIRRPLVAILATGDELLPPGAAPGPGQIIASNGYGVAALARESGADILDLGIARDTAADLEAALDKARAAPADILVTLGGASVGDHDLVQQVFVDNGMALDFWRIAMRPGKPLMLGRLGDMRILGLPGNPVSSLVCGHLFLKPLTEALAGRPNSACWIEARLDNALPENDKREDYLRARAYRDKSGALRVKTFSRQDSSMIRVFSQSNVLVRRPPFAPAAAAETLVKALALNSTPI